MMLNRYTLFAVCLSLVTGCGSNSNGSTDSLSLDSAGPTETPAPVQPTDPTEPTPPAPAPASTFTIGLLPDTQGGTDAQGQAHVAMHPMDEVLKHQSGEGVDLVLALGDLTDNGSTIEWSEWRSVAQKYADQRIEFLPVMGNHESSYAYTTEWIANMRNFIPEDAIHMPGAEWINYYVVRDNVLVIGLAYYNLPIAFDWIKDVIEEKRPEVEHIVVASHDGLIGAKYGQTLEQIVDGTKGDDWVYRVQPQIREFFSDHDVIYVQGHEHQYQRSLVARDTTLQTYPSSSTPTGGNYRMNTYTQIMSGNASYKGYEFRFGERELVQMIVSQKNATYDTGKGSDHYDVNSSLLSFTGPRVDYASYYAEHQAKSNDEQYDFDADWKLMDKFSRAVNRCESVIYPNSIIDSTRAVLVLQPEYLTDSCFADDGSQARLVGGVNNTFNRTDTRTRDLGYTPGFSRAESLADLTRLAYQWLYIYHQNWTPNLNSPARAIPDAGEDALIIPETTIDLKEHVTLSWLPADDGTRSDILIVSGTANQTGMYQGDYGEPKDIGVDAGLSYSQTDGGAKSPHTLPATATRSWDISNAIADAYAVELQGPATLDIDAVIPAIKQGDEWQPLVEADCIIEGMWDQGYLEIPPVRDTDANCDDQPLVGLDRDSGNSWWIVLNQDAELALVDR
tara:strand:+ start:2033 stop:4060 length:2028 start_codon:yes stop_codon:yes gene_type:complete